MSRSFLALLLLAGLIFTGSIRDSGQTLLAQTAGSAPPRAQRPNLSRPGGAEDEFYAQRLQGLQNGRSYSQALAGASAQRLALERARPSVAGAAASTWTNLGPNPINNGQIGDSPGPISSAPVRSRIEGIAVGPGLLKSTDAGTACPQFPSPQASGAGATRSAPRPSPQSGGTGGMVAPALVPNSSPQPGGGR